MIVADAGPLNFLIRLGREKILPELFGQVFLPYEVKTEMNHGSTPTVVSQWVGSLPAWIQVELPQPQIVGSGALHIGELAAIHHARRLSCRLLMDDMRGRIEAKRYGIPVSGTLAVLYEAGLRGLLDFEQELPRLIAMEFRASERVRQHFLAQWRNR